MQNSRTTEFLQQKEKRHWKVNTQQLRKQVAFEIIQKQIQEYTTEKLGLLQGGLSN